MNCILAMWLMVGWNCRKLGNGRRNKSNKRRLFAKNDVEIPMFVVMPNHVHLIVVYNRVVPCRDASNASACRDTSNVSADNVPDNVSADARGASLRFGPQSGNLPSVVRGIKSAVTKYANEHDIPFAWQPRFHDHIIRNWTEMNHIAQYIQHNPEKWEMDRFYKKR